MTMTITPATTTPCLNNNNVFDDDHDDDKTTTATHFRMYEDNDNKDKDKDKEVDTYVDPIFIDWGFDAKDNKTINYVHYFT